MTQDFNPEARAGAARSKELHAKLRGFLEPYDLPVRGVALAALLADYLQNFPDEEAQDGALKIILRSTINFHAHWDAKRKAS